MRPTLRKLLVDPSSRTSVQFIRYGFVSAVGLVVDFGLLVLLVQTLHLGYLIAATIAFCGGLVVNYVLSRVWVFEAATLGDERWAFLVFTVIGIVGLGINDLAMWALTGLLGVHYVVSKAVATLFTFLWNFAARKRLVFAKSSRS